MAFDPASPTLTLGVVGAGTMGRGIAQIAAAAGIEVRLCDAREGAAEEARGFIAKMLERQVEKGLAGRRAGRSSGCGSRTARTSRRAIWWSRRSSRILPPSSACSRTSSRSCDPMRCWRRTPRRSRSARSRRPAKARSGSAGWHFFNPVPLMKVVEVIPGQHTAEPVVEALQALALRMGHRPVRADRFAGLSGQPRRARLRHRGAAHPGRGHREPGRRSTASCARRPASAWGRSSSSTSSGSTSRMR